MTEAATAKRTPVTVVCVFNDPEVRAACLDRSLQDLAAEAPDTEYIPVDNTGHAHATAGDALNHGARMARHPVVVFVHQDVYLQSLRALEVAAALLLAEPTVGVVGAVGVDPSERLVGRIRDRVVLTGTQVRGLVAAESLDEVLFMVRRDDVLAEPLATHPDLAWHAYAVEYGLRHRRAGRVVRVADLPLTHNSLTINLARLDVAHRRILSDYPGLMPVATTCGPIPAPVRRGIEPLRVLRSSARWVRQSVAVRRALRDLRLSVVLADLTRDVDQLVVRWTPQVRLSQWSTSTPPTPTRRPRPGRADPARAPGRVLFGQPGADRGGGPRAAGIRSPCHRDQPRRHWRATTARRHLH